MIISIFVAMDRMGALSACFRSMPFHDTHFSFRTFPYCTYLYRTFLYRTFLYRTFPHRMVLCTGAHLQGHGDEDNVGLLWCKDQRVTCARNWWRKWSRVVTTDDANDDENYQGKNLVSGSGKLACSRSSCVMRKFWNVSKRLQTFPYFSTFPKVSARG